MDEVYRCFGLTKAPSSYLGLTRHWIDDAPVVDLEVVSVDGATLIRVSLPGTENVKTVKKLLQIGGHTNGRPPACQRLTIGSRALSDDDCLAGLGSPAIMTLVLVMFDPAKNEVLLEAARDGSMAAVESVLTALADPNYQDESRTTALHHLAARGNLESVALLCDSGADPAAPREDGATPLLASVLEGRANRAKVVEYLVSRAPDAIDHPLRNGATPLFMAAVVGHSRIVRLLCNHMADPSRAWGDGATPLHVASNNGHAKVVQHLCHARADLNASNRRGATPLFLASWEGHLSIVRCLCDEGADINKCVDDSSTPLFIACREGHRSIIQVLCDAGADTNAVGDSGECPLHVLVRRGDVLAMQLVVAAGADVNASTGSGDTALLIAARQLRPDAARFLLNAGADVDAAGPGGSTALLVATEYRRLDVVRLLLQCGADKEKASDDGTTPLRVAQRDADTRTGPLLVSLLSRCDKEAAAHMTAMASVFARLITKSGERP